jgi:hypothetical protein
VETGPVSAQPSVPIKITEPKITRKMKARSIESLRINLRNEIISGFRFQDIA